jgi:hypothetical protein
MIIQKDFDNSWSRDSLVNEFLRTHKKVLKFSVEFEEFTFEEYPDYSELTSFVDREYRNKQGELYWSGTKYERLLDLVTALSKQKNIFRIIVKYTEN